LVVEDDDGGVSTSVVTVKGPDDWTTSYSEPVVERRRGASSFGRDWTPIPDLESVLVSSIDGMEERALTYQNTDWEEPVHAEPPVATSPEPDSPTCAHLKRTSRVSDLAPPKPAPIGFGTTSTSLGRFFYASLLFHFRIHTIFGGREYEYN